MQDILPIFELQVLCFPLLVVLLACLAFLFGGHCAAWQWWTAVFIVMGMPFLRQPHWRAAIGAGLCFVGLLLSVKCLLPPLLWDNSALDMLFYHLPTVQLLSEGWNPVADPLAEDICSSLGLDLWGMAPVHVAFLFKPMAVFAAVSSKFVRDPHGLTLPVICFLWLGCFLTSIRNTRGAARWPTALSLVVVLPSVASRMFVDLAMAFVSCGLLFAMARFLQNLDTRQGRCRDTTNGWISLGVYTVWMASIKLNGVFAASVFWGLFALAICRRDRKHWAFWAGRFAFLSAITAFFWLVISWNPIVTSWKDYGHPLYPSMTSDPAAFPKRDFIWDLRVANDDFRSLGKIGTWLYEYVSHSAGRAYGKWKTGRSAFRPRRLFYGEQCMDGKTRMAVWAMFVLLFLHPRGRLWGLGGLALTFLVPTETIGYHRYQPWFSSLGCLAISLWSEWLFSKTDGKWAFAIRCGSSMCLCMVCVTWMWQHARDVDFKSREQGVSRKLIRSRLCKAGHRPSEAVKPNDFAPLYDFLTAFDNQCKLLLIAMDKTRTTQIVPPDGWTPAAGWDVELSRQPLWKWDERLWFAPEQEKPQMTIRDLGTPWREANVWDEPDSGDGIELWTMTPFGRYYVPWDADADHIRAYYLRSEPLPGESKWKCFRRRLRFFLAIWFRTYPSEVWNWLLGRRQTPPLLGQPSDSLAH